MKMIDKKSFFPTVCVVYTLLSVWKIFLEAVFQGVWGNYQENLLMMLFLSFSGILVLSQHYRLARFPLPLVIIGQYVLLLCSALFIVWVSGFFSVLHENAYRDIFLSFTIPYFVSAIIYYFYVFQEIKRANQLLDELRK